MKIATTYEELLTTANNTQGAAVPYGDCVVVAVNNMDGTYTGAIYDRKWDDEVTLMLEEPGEFEDAGHALAWGFASINDFTGE